MRIQDDIRKCVAFLGFPDARPGKGGISCIGTGFFVGFENGGYLLTAKHVAKVLGDDPFLVRVNMRDGTSRNLHADQAKWHFHDDETVDVAVLPFGGTEVMGFDILYIPEDWFAQDSAPQESWLCPRIGDFSYTVGLFRLLAGEKRNMPVVHTGNIAAMPSDEKVPVEDWDDPGEGKIKRVTAYLVETQSLQGLSGSPVFCRAAFSISEMPIKPPKMMLANDIDVQLLGLWSGAWDAPPGEALIVHHGKEMRVPVGMGIVVPISKIVEILQKRDLMDERKTYGRENAASLDVAAPPRETMRPDPGVKEAVQAESDNANPNHLEDFNRLVDAAARKRPRDGQP